MGGKIWMDKRVLLRHSGSYVFCMENQEHLMRTVGPMFLQEQQEKHGMKFIDKDGNEIKKL
jgi:hypothetical protein